MENKTNFQKSSHPVSFLLLIPSLLFGLISLIMAVIGLGLLPLFPAAIGLILGFGSFLFFRESYKTFTRIVIGISLAAVLVSVFRSTVIKPKVAEDQAFDSTMVNTQQGIETDIKDAFSDDTTGLE